MSPADYALLDPATLRWASEVMREEQLRVRRQSSWHKDERLIERDRLREAAFKSATRMLLKRASLAEAARKP